MPPIDRYRPLLLPIGIMACLVVILLPLPTPVMDLLLAGNIALAVIILLTTLHVRSPLEFSVFPTLLLATTLSRLVLNIATTRLILTGAATGGEDAAGGVVRTFGQFVAGNQVEVGLILFLILVVVQFVVITKGATRISEVAARFALDGMPGRQSAIEADLNAGNIDPETASTKREQLGAEADFFAAMDGAGKFVRGDAIAGLLITAINIVGGLYLGLFVYGMPVGQAASVFTRLTIGDGLVSQVPSLLISLSAGFLVTRGTRPTELGDNFVRQLFGQSQAMWIAGVFLVLLVVTGLPPIPLLLLGSGCVLIATTLRRSEREQEHARQRSREEQAAAESATQKRVEDFLTVDPLEVAIGLGLLPLADPSRGGDLMQRIAGLRNQMAAEIGIVLPKVRVRDDATLGDQEYEIRLFGDFVARSELRMDKLLAIGNGQTTGTLRGDVVSESKANARAVWIDPADREQALIYGYKTQTAPGVLADHLEQVARAHADELLSRDATKHLLDELRQIAPAMVEELVPGVMGVADVQKVLQGLLREAIPIRQLSLILEALSDAARVTTETEVQVEYVRRRLKRTLCSGLRDADRVLRAVALDDSVGSKLIAQAATHAGGEQGRAGRSANISQDVTCNVIRQAVKNLIDRGYPPVILVAPSLRRDVKRAADAMGIWAHVLSTDEITSDTELEVQPLASAHHASSAA
ncbi:flagellar biosynthesis protein FlhA [Roseiconus nitratireducens]|uniref:Flagellar biosynthesis protein FlhA n=1 Tax=Roseiconus nitratireducens TaxID=2605748 RepID=A0A5M6DD83_9BACT|nr:flagellar biosynthesis protein FlhA [Roseiconus nitratireducens]KAA5544426.1 flagellar biosynthesis protein FlhA [Roseiconus nitratireducens]